MEDRCVFDIDDWHSQVMMDLLVKVSRFSQGETRGNELIFRRSGEAV
jgi:hypothetical protein